MEYIEHGDLQRYLTRPFPENEAREIAYQLLEGITFMHDNMFVHRDLKPSVGILRFEVTDIEVAKIFR
jgi:serine/threonine protein kinase